ncbi:hypothetical protein SMD_3165 [Stenotrophomonas maltophilia D457]|nr:hypothetical protein SMD_3165 [Stenotrophomonas maltophilia D457]
MLRPSGPRTGKPWRGWPAPGGRLQTGSGRRWRAQTRKKPNGEARPAFVHYPGFRGPLPPFRRTASPAGQPPRPVVPAAGRQCQPRLASTRAWPRRCRSVSRPTRSCRPLAGNANQGWHLPGPGHAGAGRSAAPPGRAGRWPAMPTKVGIYQGLATQVQAGQLPRPVVPAAGRQCQPRLAATRAKPRWCRSVSRPARSCRPLAGNANQGWQLPEPGHAGAGRSAAPPGRAGRWPAMPTKVGIYQSQATQVQVGQPSHPVVPAAGRQCQPRLAATKARPRT